MKKTILTLLFASAITLNFAFNSTNEAKEIEVDFIECERATLSCGITGVACAETKEGVKQVIKNADEALCD